MLQSLNKNKFSHQTFFKNLKNVFYTCVLFLISTSSSLAQALPNSVPQTSAACPAGQLCNPLKAKSLTQFFDGIIGVAIQLGAVIAGLSIMYGGFLYVTALGDEEKITKAYKTMTWSLVGTAVLLGAHVIMLAIRGTIEQLN